MAPETFFSKMIQFALNVDRRAPPWTHSLASCSQNNFVSQIPSSIISIFVLLRHRDCVVETKASWACGRWWSDLGAQSSHMLLDHIAPRVLLPSSITVRHFLCDIAMAVMRCQGVVVREQDGGFFLTEVGRGSNFQCARLLLLALERSHQALEHLSEATHFLV